MKRGKKEEREEKAGEEGSGRARGQLSRVIITTNGQGEKYSPSSWQGVVYKTQMLSIKVRFERFLMKGQVTASALELSLQIMWRKMSCIIFNLYPKGFSCREGASCHPVPLF